MSDAEIPVPGSKKRRLQGACDLCRSKKIRCDSAKMPNNICSNCIAFDSKCTHLASAANRRTGTKAQQTPLTDEFPRTAIPTPAQSQIAAILSQTSPYSLPQDSSSVMRILVDISTYARKLEQELAVLKGTDTSIVDPSSAYTRPPTPTDLSLTATDGCVLTDLNERMKGLMVGSSHNRFYGQSSDIMLLKTAMDIKGASGDDKRLADHLIAIKRPEYWNSHPWHQPPPEAPDIYIFPEKDLMDSLMSLYFFHVHPLIPLLHRNTFERSVAEGLHLRNSRFGATLLLVCSLAARYSSDPRVYLEGTNSEHSCGWKWIGQIRLVRQSFTTTPSLYDVQICCLAVIFLQGTGCPELCWVLTSIGIRLAQDVGAHRRRRYTGDKPAEDQLWTRAFWVLVCIDILLSASFGRPRATTADDFDLDLPIECDDIYWESSEPGMAFKQPDGVPSMLSYLNCYIKLLDILGFAQRTLYTLKRSKKRGAEEEQWNRQVVAELDSAMNGWIDSLPNHLRWDPHRENHIFSQQSASLHASYYHVQIQIHRPFIPAPGRSSPLSYSSLAVCANSARSCSHVMNVQSRRGILPLAHVKMALFDSAVILLLIVWSRKQTGMVIDASKEIRDVHACLNVLRSFERRWQIAGRLWDTIYAMLSAGDLLSEPTLPSLKRDRDADARSSLSPGAASTSSSENSSIQPRSIAGSRRASQVPLFQPPTQDEPLHVLPVHSAELGRLPVQQFEITNPFVPSGARGYLAPENEGFAGWSAPFAESQDGPEKVLPSDFFTSLLDNTTFGTGEGPPEWAYSPGTGANWTDWDHQYSQGHMNNTTP
ncbi:fungal-specific transcription factor domain-containing protein [Mycena vulgaris]|nr:fungal-specific transcription factor domain-containing protein [Mycena vulgaris]